VVFVGVVSVTATDTMNTENMTQYELYDNEKCKIMANCVDNTTVNLPSNKVELFILSCWSLKLSCTCASLTNVVCQKINNEKVNYIESKSKSLNVEKQFTH